MFTVSQYSFQSCALLVSGRVEESAVSANVILLSFQSAGSAATDSFGMQALLQLQNRILSSCLHGV